MYEGKVLYSIISYVKHDFWNVKKYVLNYVLKNMYINILLKNNIVNTKILSRHTSMYIQK